MSLFLHGLAFVSTKPLPGPFCPTGYCSDGGKAGWFHILLNSWQSHAFSWWRPELHPPPGHRIGSGLPGQIPWGSHHLTLLLRTTGEPWEATPRCEYAKMWRVCKKLSARVLTPCHVRSFLWIPKHKSMSAKVVMSSHQGRGHL